jgi:hypothetical protein
MKLIIEVPAINIHLHTYSTSDSRVDEILAGIQRLFKQGEEIKMAISVAEQTIIDRFNAATSAIAAKIQVLIDNPPADDSEFNAQLKTIADGLDALGQTGVPPVEPTA